MTGGFFAQRASNAERVSMPLCHQDVVQIYQDDKREVGPNPI